MAVELQRAYWVFPAEVRTIPQARMLLAQTLSHLHRETLDLVLLMAGELVTNAVRHGAGPVSVDVAWGDADVRVEVTDQSPRGPELQAVDADSLSGRGLLIVDGLSSRWGVQAAPVGKKVWFSVEFA